MDGLHEVAGSGVLVTLAGNDYTLLPLRAKDWGEAARYLNRLRPAPLEMVKARLEGLAQPDRDRLLELAFREERDGDLLDMNTVQKWFCTPEGAAYKLWMGLRRTHSLTLDECGELLKRTNAEEDETLARSARASEGLPEGNCSGLS